MARSTPTPARHPLTLVQIPRDLRTAFTGSDQSALPCERGATPPPKLPATMSLPGVWGGGSTEAQQRLRGRTSSYESGPGRARLPRPSPCTLASGASSWHWPGQSRRGAPRRAPRVAHRPTLRPRARRRHGRWRRARRRHGRWRLAPVRHGPSTSVGFGRVGPAPAPAAVKMASKPTRSGLCGCPPSVKITSAAVATASSGASRCGAPSQRRA